MADEEGTSRISTIFGATAALSRSGSCRKVTSLPLPKEMPAHAVAGMSETAPAAEIRARVTQRRGLAARNDVFFMSDPPDNAEGMLWLAGSCWRHLSVAVTTASRPSARANGLPHHLPF